MKKLMFAFALFFGCQSVFAGDFSQALKKSLGLPARTVVFTTKELASIAKFICSEAGVLLNVPVQGIKTGSKKLYRTVCCKRQKRDAYGNLYGPEFKFSAEKTTCSALLVAGMLLIIHHNNPSYFENLKEFFTAEQLSALKNSTEVRLQDMCKLLQSFSQEKFEALSAFIISSFERSSEFTKTQTSDLWKYVSGLALSFTEYFARKIKRFAKNYYF